MPPPAPAVGYVQRVHMKNVLTTVGAFSSHEFGPWPEQIWLEAIDLINTGTASLTHAGATWGANLTAYAGGGVMNQTIQHPFSVGTGSTHTGRGYEKLIHHQWAPRPGSWLNVFIRDEEAVQIPWTIIVRTYERFSRETPVVRHAVATSKLARQ